MARRGDTVGAGRGGVREARRRELIEATISSIAKRGLSGTTLNSVTEEAGLSHGTVNFHFVSKEALYAETLRALADEHQVHWQGALDQAGPDPAERLSAVVAADFAPAVCSRRKVAVWFAFWGQARHRPTYLAIQSAHDDHRRERLENLCADLAAAGGYDEIVPKVAARNLEAVIDGLWLQVLLYPKEMKREEALANAKAFLASLFPRHFEV
ncbi:transcriptional regulator BetI [Marivibrio halodurans]|uniref:Transcriptional regulator BetI n=1 Tax=Marivibrio halodurans TaxID=2039722 RepID=A0A8J7SJN3_9PROT|nr:transcriptional regulator BetI [Marivibrio halodurans]MBP5855723.1 transcriptional regulator BetI [Marivibrio halodurans]